MKLFLLASLSVEATKQPVRSDTFGVTRSNESNGGSPGTGGGGDNNGGGGSGCIGDGCYPDTTKSTTRSTTQTTQPPPSNSVERIMANELEWCGYLRLR